jgi:hypothetical protein
MVGAVADTRAPDPVEIIPNSANVVGLLSNESYVNRILAGEPTDVIRPLASTVKGCIDVVELLYVPGTTPLLVSVVLIVPDCNCVDEAVTSPVITKV